MNNILKRTLITALVAATTFGLTADGGKWGHNSEQHLKRMAKSLDLSKDQVSKIEEIHKASEPEKKSKSDQIQKVRQDMRALMEAEEMDVKKIRSKMEEMSKLKVDKKMIWIEDRAKIRKVLTPEQRKKQKELMKKAHAKMKDKNKNWDKKKNRD
ncbi:MAG: periplasmic heavy metal sensor [Leptospira sp.]|nr:periplasmic heavy metal sensor [Leptospira sp.]